MPHAEWAAELRAIHRSVERLERIASDTSRRTCDNAAGSPLGALIAEIHALRDSADAALARYSLGPAAKFLAGIALTREEFHLCRAMGADFGTAFQIGVSSFDDYDTYRMLCYEDDTSRCYINIHLEPRDSSARRVGGRLGRPPEECRRRHLRPEQDSFFRSHLPEVYRRFADG